METLRLRAVVILVGVFFAVMMISASIAGYRTLNSPASLGQASDPGWWVSERDRDLKIISVRRDGPADRALAVGDRVVAINGHELLGGFQAASLFDHIPPDSDYTIVVEREGRLREFTLKTVAIPRGLRTFLPLATVLIPAIFLFSGLAIFLLKPTDKQSRLLALTFGTSSGLFASDFSPGLSGVQIVVFAAAVLSSFFWPVFLHFFLVFPTPKETLSPVLRRFPRIEYTLYLPHLLLTLPYSVIWGFYRAVAHDEFAGIIGSYGWLSFLATTLPVVYVGAGLFSLLLNYRRATRLLRRKMRVVVAGSIFALLPMLAFIALGLFFSDAVSESVLIWFAVIAVSAFALFPLSFLYAIARHQVIPVRLILRRGARYVFVSRGSIILELVAVGLVLTLLLRYVFSRLNLNALQIGLLSGAVSVLVWQVARQLHQRTIGPLIDRSFFRQAYNAQQILSELGQTLRVMASIDEGTFARISESIRAALHAENVSIFIRDVLTDDHTCVVISQRVDGDGEEIRIRPGLAFSSAGFVAKRLNESVRPLRVDFGDPQSWARAYTARGAGGSAGDERDAKVLKELRSALLLPIATKEQLIGIMSLGPRLGDLPYSREDEHLLSAVSWQIAYAIENAHLVRQRADEDRLQREIEFATHVQRRLFPQTIPSTDTLDLSGVCHPAGGVGGDYYDFLVLENGQIGIAVADVSGKGMSAALLMSTVQASLRTQASFANGRITELVSSMNRLLCESTDMSHYATFFYAEYDDTARHLTYVNAGHNPPMLFRNKLNAMSNAGEGVVQRFPLRDVVALPTAMDSVQLLQTGGPVIGLLRDCLYERESIQMLRGDVLIAYTDGVSEARDPDDEEFGEERLASLVLQNLHLGADEIREQIVDGVRIWCRGAALHDDLTLVVVKIKD